MNAHTSGPWRVSHFPNSRQSRVVAEGGVEFLETANPGISTDTWNANLHLVAAAPDLYLALKSVLAQFSAGMFQRNTDSDGCSDWAIKAAGPLRVLADAQRAIAKAEGTAPARAEVESGGDQ